MLTVSDCIIHSAEIVAYHQSHTCYFNKIYKLCNNCFMINPNKVSINLCHSVCTHYPCVKFLSKFPVGSFVLLMDFSKGKVQGAAKTVWYHIHKHWDDKVLRC